LSPPPHFCASVRFTMNCADLFGQLRGTLGPSFSVYMPYSVSVCASVRFTMNCADLFGQLCGPHFDARLKEPIGGDAQTKDRPSR
jgi:hypothetical protein